MSYNGIGLATVRGSGTNGFVQRNLSALRRIKEKIGFKSEEELASFDLRNDKKPNLELLEHDRKRRVEVKCMELQDLMEEQGYDEDEIQKKVDSYRQMLLENQECLPGKEDSGGRPVITETHQIAEMKEKENETLRAAFGIRKDYVRGSAFMNDGAPPKTEEPKKYKLVRTPSKSPSPDRAKEKRLAEKKRRKKSSSIESSASEKKKKKASKRKHQSRKHSVSDESLDLERRKKKSSKKKHSSRKNESSEEISDSDKKRKRSSKRKRQSQKYSYSSSDSPEPRHKSKKNKR